MKAMINLISGDDDNLAYAIKVAKAYGFENINGFGEHQIEASKEEIESLAHAIYEGGVEPIGWIKYDNGDEIIFDPEYYEWMECCH